MAAVAQRNLAGFGAVEVVAADFETWLLPEGPFDAVVSATAFHWIDPAVRMVKAADALRPGGALAVVATQHVAGGSEEFFVEVQDCYERFDSATPPGLRLPAAEDVDTSDHADEVARSGRFGPVVFRRYEWDLTYTTAQYLEVLRLLRPPGAAAGGQGWAAGVHRRADRRAVRRPGHQAVSHGAAIVANGPTFFGRCGSSRAHSASDRSPSPTQSPTSHPLAHQATHLTVPSSELMSPAASSRPTC